MRPLIGITTYLTRATFGSWEEESALVPADYVRAIERAGGRALLVPPCDDGVEETLDALDGMSSRAAPISTRSTYGAGPHAATTASSRSATARSWRCCRRHSHATCRCSASAAARRC